MEKAIAKFKNQSQKIKMKITKAAPNLMPMLFALALIGISFATNGAYAAGNAKGLFTLVIGWVGKIAMAIGAFYAVFGIIHYASANSEGDGPAKQKAIMQLASGVLLVIVSAILTGAAGTLASYIS